MQQAQRLGKQTDDPRIKLSFEEVDELDADLLGGIFETFGKNSGQTQGDFGMLRQQISEIRAGQGEDDGGLNRGHGRGSRFAGQQRHFADCRSFDELSDEEIDAGGRILLANFDQART